MAFSQTLKIHSIQIYMYNYIHTGILVKLLEGSSYNWGRLEVYYKGEWGVVSTDGWDDTDAGVVCRQLGFGSSGTATELPSFGHRSILLSHLLCNGDELQLSSCSHPGINVTDPFYRSHYSEFYKDAGVICDKDWTSKDCI